jgi:ribonuclease P protein component
MSKNTFPASRRLDQQGVQQTLRKGRRKHGLAFEIRQVSSETEERKDGARLAISVPKRLLKSAVHRNQVKRVVRESFRQHAIAKRPLEILVIFRGKPSLPGNEKKTYRMDIEALFTGAEAGFVASHSCAA